MSTQELLFRRIDDALAKYYSRLGRSDYVSRNGNGLFLQYIIDEELIHPDIPIESELDIQCDPYDCTYTAFVDNDKFPIPAGARIPDRGKTVYIFYILQYCWQYGSPPSNEFIKQQLTPKVLLMQMYQEVFVWMIGFASGWLWITGLYLDYWFHIFMLIVEDGYSSDDNNIIELEEGEPFSVQSD